MEKKQIKIKLFKSKDLEEIENQVNKYLERQREERFLYDRINVIIQDDFFIAILTLKFNNYVVNFRKKNGTNMIKTVCDSKITGLEKKINNLISTMQKEKFFMIDLDIQKESKMFIAIASFHYGSYIYQV